MIIPVILSGGSGTRLWPLSRSMYPKQFIRFFDKDDPSLLGTTLRRLGDDEAFAPPLVLCNSDHRFLIRDELSEAGIAPQGIFLEPVARNTAAAVAVAALAAEQAFRDAVLAVMPSDHVVEQQAEFAKAIKTAATIAAKGKLVLFGIKPDSPHTGYGYVRRGAALNGTAGFAVDAFVEKPNRKTAEGYLKAGDYLWNSGIFVLHARTFLDELRRYAPDVLAAASAAFEKSTEDFGFVRLDPVAFASSPNISIDYAVMEKTQAAAVLPLDVGWNDVGSWSSLWQISPHDAAGNAVNGDALLLDTNDCYVHSDRSLVSMVGVDNLIVVNTPDALLVAQKDRAQDVSRLVASLKQSNRKEHQQHLRNARPWGFFETLSIGERFQVKRLHVNPGAKLSMQMHHHRSEHWVVVRGTALVSIGDTEKLVQENESAYIKSTQWHRLENPGKVPLDMIEVQIGSYLGEDDIVRTDDIYHRSADETK
ncbi:mannose-1-phosphate guanylyltransferase/mannose-6-phosphate isomerase [Hyphomicrobium sp.]|uniref:mannose-1-phosphate guanylyltransferase/mannose-6-phosphate isomerase n=1 Tax=Hyphomicrobium sp. TaxID=82 RepID=UPI0025B84396|nr:mannose-1-phosphate guanylyltransferase/mannose-6-phosphate isomerase [Hyphomicrobium sp.]MCC7250771.1 mannose-1-phosphate guanylyltransferase/mannose-6-phosphate isomerase [Hyphomicrobium sp.]